MPTMNPTTSVENLSTDVDNSSQNFLSPLGEKIFLDRYALKDGSKQSLAVGDTVIVCVDLKSGQREIGTVRSLSQGVATIELRDGAMVERAVEHIDKPLEIFPEQMMERVAHGIAAVETTEEKRAEWEKKFRWLLDGWKFVPGGRILTAAGTEQQLTYYNCMPPEQEILTADGYKPIAEVDVGDFVVTHRHRLRRVLHKFERETEEPLFIIKPKKLGDGDLRVTGDHKVLAIRSEWVNRHRSRDGLRLRQEAQWIPARELKPGDYLAAVYESAEALVDSVSVLDFAPSDYQVTSDGTLLKPSQGGAYRGCPPYDFEHDGLRWVRIDEIAIEDYSGVVLDIEVEEDHSFVSAGVVVSNCYVIPSPKDSRKGIVDTLSQMMEIMSRGGGVGVNISSLRPRHAYVKGVNGRSSGSVSWGALYSFVTGLIEQGGSRRGALMLILNVWHPDVLEFIHSKREMGKITNANISVGITDSFMEAVKKDQDWDLVFPDTGDPEYDEVWDGDLERWKSLGKRVLVHKTVRARDVWNAIIESAWASAEPGVWFMERANKMSNSWYFAPLVCTNPCVTGDTLVATEHGYTKARDLKVDMKIRTPAGLKPIEKIYNNGFQRICRVEFSDGGYLECTRDHKLKVVRNKKYEWVPVAKLRRGDKVLVAPHESFGPRRKLPQDALDYIEKRGLNVADHYNRTLGLLVGVVIGDGILREVHNRGSHSYQCKVAFGAHEDAWSDKFSALMSEMNIHTHRTLSEKEFSVVAQSDRLRYMGDGTLVVHASVQLECYELATLLIKIGMKPNQEAQHKVIPHAFLGMEKEFLAGILDGLFSTDGSVLMKQDNPMLRFHTTSYELAQQVRLLLLQFGIHGRIYRVTREEDIECDGRSMFGTGEKFDVVIMNEGVPRFYSEIGLSHPEKAARLKEIAENWHYLGGTWTASVVSIQDTEREEEVYDVYEPETLTWVTNGYVSLDCGEQPLPAFSVCNLGAINLAKFAWDGQNVDWEALRKTVRYAVRFLDNVIDATPYFFEENEKQQKSERRVGLGTMGLAEMLIRLGIRYGSEESVKFIDQLYKFIATEAYLASAEYAAEKGAFPQFDAEKFLQSGFMRTMPEVVRKAVREKGIRNVTLLTQAPTGTTGTLVGTSTGIEPFYFWTYYRKSRLGKHEEKVKVLEEWQQAHPNEPLPHYFVTAMDLTPEEHVRVEAAIQRWTDSAISKTCNVPQDYTVEQTRQLYELMYELGCKGGTIYRDKSRDEQVLNLKETAEGGGGAGVPASPQKPIPKVRPRPYKRRGVTISKATPVGTAHITMNDDDEGNPFEVFLEIGKAGSDLKAMAEAVGRLMSLVLRLASPVTPKERVQEIVNQIRGIGGARHLGFGKDRVLSLPDAVGQALEEHYGVQGNGNGSSHSLLEDETPAANGKPHYAGADLCPQCGLAVFVRTEGCHTCLSCGYSEC